MTTTESLANDATPSAPLATDPAAVYAERRDRFAAERDDYNARRYFAANLTVIFFLSALISAGFAVFVGMPLLLLLTAALLIAFVAAFGVQARLDTLHRRYGTLWTLNREGLLRLARDWQALPLRQPPDAPEHHLYAGDLDVLGRASLQHLLNGTGTPGGRTLLQEWLLAPETPATIRERQAAVAELAPQIDFRDDLALGGRHMDVSPAAFAGFLRWAEGPMWLAQRPWLIWLSRLSPLLLLGLLLAQLTGLTPYPFWLLFLGANLATTALVGKPVERILDSVADRQGAFIPYGDLFRLITTPRWSAPLLRRIQAALNAGPLNAENEMRRLGRIMQFGDLRLSLFFPVLQASLLWNFHTLWLLEGWQRRAGRSVRGWIALLSEIDALGAVGALAFDNPGWCYPVIDEAGSAELVARKLGHPLIAPAACVANDVSVGPPGRFLLVTGSNMSGKSTLLRAIGLNIVLAQLGGPVCAEELRMPPLALATSMRVQDSLEQGVSYFLAELQRLQEVVALCEQARAEGTRTPFFLLDEILHGTNTSERQIAARRIIRHLLAVGATGAVSTHDLTLATDPAIAAHSALVHFTETVTRDADNRPSMSFDYLLRPGLATSTNALTLMEIVGLPMEDEAIE